MWCQIPVLELHQTEPFPSRQFLDRRAQGAACVHLQTVRQPREKPPGVSEERAGQGVSGGEVLPLGHEMDIYAFVLEM